MHPTLANLLASIGVFLPALPPLPEFSWTPGRICRSRTANGNAEERRRDGIPHGTPGAKLARKAAAGTIGRGTLR